MNPDGWLDVSAQSIRAIDCVLSRSQFEKQIVGNNSHKPKTIKNNYANNILNSTETR